MLASPLTSSMARRASDRAPEARRELFAYLEGYHNRQRLHSALGYRTSKEAEQLAA
jgi:transposase InsO family protein